MGKPPGKCYPLPLNIAGMGHYVPQNVISSQALEEERSLEPGWCEKNLGIRERRWITGETPSFLGAKAAREALAVAGMEADDIDLIVSASGTAALERGLPDGGPLLQRHLGLEGSGIPCFTMHNNDLGFMLALDNCSAMLNAGRYENILLVCAEVFSRNLDDDNPHVYGLFGDGAAAAVLRPPRPGENSSILGARFETHSAAAADYHSLMGLALSGRTTISPGDLSLHIDSRSFSDHSRRFMAGLLDRFSQERADIRQDIGLFSAPPPGQPFLYSLMVGGAKPQSLDTGMMQWGFCGAAAIPLALCQAVSQGKVARGDRLLLVGAGAGLAVGAMILSY